MHPSNILDCVVRSVTHALLQPIEAVQYHTVCIAVLQQSLCTVACSLSPTQCLGIGMLHIHACCSPTHCLGKINTSKYQIAHYNKLLLPKILYGQHHTAIICSTASCKSLTKARICPVIWRALTLESPAMYIFCIESSAYNHEIIIAIAQTAASIHGSVEHIHAYIFSRVGLQCAFSVNLNEKL